MKKLIAIFFLLIGSLQFLPAVSAMSHEVAICLETDEDKSSGEKNKDGKKEKGDFKIYLVYTERINGISLSLQLHHSAQIFSLQRPVTDILTPPPDHC